MSLHQTQSDFLAVMDARATLEDYFIGTIVNMGSSLIAESGDNITIIVIITIVVSERDYCPGLLSSQIVHLRRIDPHTGIRHREDTTKFFSRRVRAS
jgi:predicted transcriptional regulator